MIHKLTLLILLGLPLMACAERRCVTLTVNTYGTSTNYIDELRLKTNEVAQMLSCKEQFDEPWKIFIDFDSEPSKWPQLTNLTAYKRAGAKIADNPTFFGPGLVQLKAAGTNQAAACTFEIWEGRNDTSFRMLSFPTGVVIRVTRYVGLLTPSSSLGPFPQETILTQAIPGKQPFPYMDILLYPQETALAHLGEAALFIKMDGTYEIRGGSPEERFQLLQKTKRERKGIEPVLKD